MKPYIEVIDVSKRYGRHLVLDAVSLHVQQGQLHGFVGRNGSGKTQLFKCICGYVRPETGEVRVKGRRIGKDIAYPGSLGLILEQPGFLPQYTGRSNLALLMGLTGRVDRARIDRALQAVGLLEAASKRVRSYSLGMRQRLGIAQAIMEEPELLILDEPFNGLDENGVRDIRKLLLTLKNQGRTILLASHNPEDISTLCDTVHRMAAGKLITEA
ncbi:MAG: ATP-binding cassette domain-containing protein [Clostridiales bacterium]|nr:ATP-binding cassette domain-containing protein [Clostridiales bacterium]